MPVKENSVLNSEVMTQVKNLLFVSQPQLEGFAPLNYNLFGKFKHYPTRVGARNGVGGMGSMGSVALVQSGGWISEYLVMEMEALDSYFDDSELNSNAMNLSELSGAMGALSMTDTDSIMSLDGSITSYKNDRNVQFLQNYKGPMDTKVSKPSAKTALTTSTIASSVYSVESDAIYGSEIALPAFTFQYAYYLPVADDTYQHYLDREKKITLPFVPIAYFEMKSSCVEKPSNEINMEDVDEKPLINSWDSFGYFISSQGDICRINPDLQIENLATQDSKKLRITLAAASQCYITMYCKDPETLIVYSIEKNQMIQFHPSDYRAQLGALDGLVIAETTLGILVFTTGNRQITILKVQNVDHVEEDGTWTPILQHLNKSFPIQRDHVFAICPLPIPQYLRTTDDFMTERTSQVLIAYRSNTSDQIIVDILDLDTLSSSIGTDSTISSYIVEGLTASEDILDLKVLEGSIHFHQSKITAFTLRVLRENSISDIRVSLEYDQCIKYMISMGTNLFLKENRKEVLKRLDTLKMFNLENGMPIPEKSEIRQILNFLMQNDLTSIITHYISYAPQNEIGDHIYILHDASEVFDWVRDVYYLINTKARKMVSELIHQGQRGFASAEKIKTLQKISEYVLKMHSVLLILEALNTRPQDEKEQCRISAFCGDIERSIDYVRVAEWLFTYGFLPVSRGEYNSAPLEEHWRLKFETFSFQEFNSINMDTLECRKSVFELRNFISILISLSSKLDFHYPPRCISSILDLFEGDSDINKSREEVITELQYNHLVVLYLLYHNQMIAESPDLEIVSQYVRQFNITEGWQKLICAFFELDTGIISYPTTLNYLKNGVVPDHFHENIVYAFYSLQDFKSANLYLDLHPEAIISPFLKLDCLLARNLLYDALQFQRSIEEDEEVKVALFSEIISYCLSNNNHVTLLTYHFQPHEEELLFRYLRNQGHVDVLTSYYILQNRLEDAARLHTISDTPFSNNALTNVLKVLPRLQRNQLIGLQKSIGQPSALHQIPTFTSPAIRGVVEKASQRMTPEDSEILKQKRSRKRDSEDIVERPFKR